jgi:hypothetical protein
VVLLQYLLGQTDRQTDTFVNIATNRSAGFLAQNRTAGSYNEEVPADVLVTLHVVTLDRKV